MPAGKGSTVSNYNKARRRRIVNERRSNDGGDGSKNSRAVSLLYSVTTSDHKHNLYRPNCSLLEQLAKDLLSPLLPASTLETWNDLMQKSSTSIGGDQSNEQGTGSNEKSSSRKTKDKRRSSTEKDKLNNTLDDVAREAFLKILRSRLLDRYALYRQQLQESNQAINNSSKNNKKRKKKKKKATTTETNNEDKLSKTDRANNEESVEQSAIGKDRKDAITVEADTSDSLQISKAVDPSPIKPLSTNSDYTNKYEQTSDCMQTSIRLLFERMNEADDLIKNGQSELISSESGDSLTLFLEFVQHKYKLPLDDNDSATGSKKVDDLPVSPSVSFPESLVRSTTSIIECKACRERVEGIIEAGSGHIAWMGYSSQAKSTENELTVSNGGYVSLDDPTDQHYHTQNAIDYIAMEEGVTAADNCGTGLRDLERNSAMNSSDLNYISQQRLMWDLVAPTHERSIGNKIALSKFDSDASTNELCWTLKREEESALLSSLQDIDFLLDYLVESGAPIDVLRQSHQDKAALDDETLSSVVKKVDKRLQSEFKKIASIATKLEKQVRAFQVIFQNVKSFNGSGSVDISSFSAMKEVDDEVCALLQQVTNLLHGMSKKARVVMSYFPLKNNQAHWTFESIGRLWQIYFDAIKDILTATTEFELGCRKEADRHGKIPPMFLNSMVRRHYSELLRLKISSVTILVDSYKRGLEELVEFDTALYPGSMSSFCHVLLTYDEYCNCFLQSESNNKLTTTVDESCISLLTLFRECIETVHHGSIDKIVETRLAQLQRIHQVLQIKEKSDFSNGDNAINNKVKEPIEVSCDDVDGLLTKRLDTCRSLSVTILNWAKGNDVKEREGVQERYLPTFLLQSLTSNSNTIDPHGSVHDTNVRVSCIFSFLLYSWLANQCQEWQSIKAEKELIDVSSRQGEHDTPPKKQKAKKKETTKSLTKQTDLAASRAADTPRHVDENLEVRTEDVKVLQDEVVSSSPDRVDKIVEMQHVDVNNTGNDNIIDTDELEEVNLPVSEPPERIEGNTKVIESNVEISGENCSYDKEVTNGSKSNAKVADAPTEERCNDNDVTKTDTEAITEPVFYEDEEEAPEKPSVYIIDEKNNKVHVEDFLYDRLVAVLKDANKYKNVIT